MHIIKNITSMQKEIARIKRSGKSIGFVPTMGFLHEGHLSLLRRSKKENDISILSIFVNPRQFGPAEDFGRYPRNLKKDILFAKRNCVDIIFYPSVVDMYPQGFLTSVSLERITDVMCGKFRPGHFTGVATVVVKLINIVSPHVMYLGQKDAQQVIVLKRMIKDLNFPLTVKVMPTVREKDGIAMSSRNTYLNSQERKNAAVLFKSLQDARSIIAKGEYNALKIVSHIKKMIEPIHSAKIDYIECRDAESLELVRKIKGKVLIALAVWIGKTRLIDNIIVSAP